MNTQKRRKRSRYQDFILNAPLPVTSLPLENKVELSSRGGKSDADRKPVGGATWRHESGVKGGLTARRYRPVETEEPEHPTAPKEKCKFDFKVFTLLSVGLSESAGNSLAWFKIPILSKVTTITRISKYISIYIDIYLPRLCCPECL